MRFLLAIVGIAALVVIALVSLGMLKIGTTAGSLPSISVNGGKAPEVTANMATVEFGTTTKTVEVPTVKVTKPGDTGGNTVTAN